MSLDKRPYIGPYSKNTPDLFVATGFGKWGMTGSMLAAMILSDLVQEKNNEYSTVFSPSRNMLKPQLISNLGHALVGIGRIGGKRCSHMGCVLVCDAYYILLNDRTGIQFGGNIMAGRTTLSSLRSLVQNLIMQRLNEE